MAFPLSFPWCPDRSRSQRRSPMVASHRSRWCAGHVCVQHSAAQRMAWHGIDCPAGVRRTEGERRRRWARAISRQFPPLSNRHLDAQCVSHVISCDNISITAAIRGTRKQELKRCEYFAFANDVSTHRCCRWFSSSFCTALPICIQSFAERMPTIRLPFRGFGSKQLPASHVSLLLPTPPAPRPTHVLRAASRRIPSHRPDRPLESHSDHCELPPLRAPTHPPLGRSQ